MSFEDDMFEAGFNNEMDYADYLIDQALGHYAGPDYYDINDNKYDSSDLKDHQLHRIDIEEALFDHERDILADLLSYVPKRLDFNRYLSSSGKLVVPRDDIDMQENGITLDSNDFYCITPLYPKLDSYSSPKWMEYQHKNQFAIVRDCRGKYGLVNRYGALIVPCIYDFLYYHEIYGKSSIIIVYHNDRYGCINSFGEIIIPIVNRKMKIIRNQIVINGYMVNNLTTLGIRIGEKYYTNFTGCFASGFKDVFYVRENGYWGAVNTKGEVVLDMIFDHVRPQNYGLAAICKHRKWGFINEKQEIVIPLKYDSVTDLSLFPRMMDVDYLKSKECWEISPSLNCPEDKFEGYKFLDGMALDRMLQASEEGNDVEYEYWRNKWEEYTNTYINLEWDPGCLDTPEYKKYLKELHAKRDYALAISIVKIDGREGVINRIGEELIACRYKGIKISDAGSTFSAKLVSTCRSFSLKYLSLTYNGYCVIGGNIYKKHDAVYPTRYKRLFVTVKNSKVGLMTIDGKTIIPCRYKRLDLMNRYTAVCEIRDGSKKMIEFDIS